MSALHDSTLSRVPGRGRTGRRVPQSSPAVSRVQPRSIWLLSIDLYQLEGRRHLIKTVPIASYIVVMFDATRCHALAFAALRRLYPDGDS
jgi:hypothetical protein